MTQLELNLRVARRRMLTPRVCELVLQDPAGGPLPEFTPGAHLTLQTPSGDRRSYSLTGSPADTSRYVVAVQREEAGRGGSRSVVDDLREGDLLPVGPPRNAFPVVESERYLLVAGGIGITPIRCMFHALRSAGAEVHLLYLTRSRGETAYVEELSDPALAGAVTLHHDDESGRPDLWPWLAEPRDDTRVYCCGPAPLMDAVLGLTMHWRPSRIHTERFSGVEALGGPSSPFTAVWQPDGRVVEVDADVTFLSALRRAGVQVDSSCESGTCGTCRLRLLDGAADHRDLVLSEVERGSSIMPCVSRGTGRIEIGPWP